MIDTATPYDIDQMSLDQVLDLVDDNNCGIKGLPGKQARFRILKAIFEVLGYDLSPDLMLALLAKPKHKLIIATAGAGKTTGSQLGSVADKVFMERALGRPLWGTRMLCLVYNDQNVEPMKATHNKMISRLLNSGIQGLNIDKGIEARTFHSFCNMWMQEYAGQCGVFGFSLMKGLEHTSFMNVAINKIKERHGVQQLVIYPKQLHEFYTYAKECLLDFDDLKLLSKYPEVANIPPHVLSDIFKYYEVWKKQKKKYEYIDQIYKVYELFKNNEAARKHVQDYYDCTVADELQDFTPLMMATLKLIVGDKPLLAIADEDQTLYGFKGADVDNALSFTNFFTEGQVFVLNTNRRCPEAVGIRATHIITENQYRFNKKILFSKKGGQPPEYVAYNTEDGQLLNVVKRIEAMDPKERASTVVGYRDRIMALQLSEMLEEREIPFHILSGSGPFSHELYGHVKDVLNLLLDPYDTMARINMHKVLPISKDEWFQIIEWDPAKNKFLRDPQRIHFLELDFGMYADRKKFMEQVRVLGEVSKKVYSQPLSSYFTVVYDSLLAYFWKWKKENSLNEAHDELYTNKVFEFFNSNRTFIQLSNHLDDRETRIKSWQRNTVGVALGTFHSLKGLEYDNVFLLYLDDNVMPKLDYSRRFEDEASAIADRESETRVMFVAMTRTKKNLTMYYPVSNPSHYIRRLLAFEEELKRQEAEKVPKVYDKPMPQVDISQSLASSNRNVSGMSNFLGSAFDRLK